MYTIEGHQGKSSRSRMRVTEFQPRPQQGGLWGLSPPGQSVSPLKIFYLEYSPQKISTSAYDFAPFLALILIISPALAITLAPVLASGQSLAPGLAPVLAPGPSSVPISDRVLAPVTYSAPFLAPALTPLLQNQF